MKVTRAIIYTIAILVIGGLVSNVTNYAYEQSSEPTQVSVDATKKNAAKVKFVEGCVGEGGTDSQCQCAFDALDKHYSYKWYEDEGLINRIVQEGYNYEETKAMQTCISTNQEEL